MAIREVMQRADAVRSGMALGGIGAGTMELRKNGVFYNWNIANSAPLFTGRLLQGEAEHNAPRPFTDRICSFLSCATRWPATARASSCCKSRMAMSWPAWKN